MGCAYSLVLYGDSGDGKTPLLGELAEHLFVTSGGKIVNRKAVGGRISRIYVRDGGGWETIMPYINLGIVEIEDVRSLPNPFSWLNKISRGMVLRDGKWVTPPLDNIGMLGYEGLTACGDALMGSLQDQAANNVNIGGGGASNFKDGDLVVGSNNMTHYNQAQTALYKAVATSQNSVPNHVVVAWTAMARRGQDADNLSTIIGPQLPGKAMTSDVPRWFVYSFRLMTIPADEMTGQKEEHRLYLADHIDKLAANAKSLGNSRSPLDAPSLPQYIQPASLVGALKLCREAQLKAEEKIIERLSK